MAPSWIITLHAGAAPALVPEPRGLLARFDFFTSRTLEDGRERFRLHLGFFEDLPSAKSVLAVVRETYPAAWLVPADRYQSLRRANKEPAVEAAVDLTAPPIAVPAAAMHAAAEPARTLEVATESAPVALQQSAVASAEAAEVFAWLGGAADLLAGVLPGVHLDDAGIAVEAVSPGPGYAPATAPDRAAHESARDPDQRLAEALVRDVSRFIVEEWQPEARRPLRPVAERAWFTRFRRGQRPVRAHSAAS